MARLHGVKTLDMVNGEITKVAYDGTEYERVEGGAQKGDIVLVKEEWGDQRVGEFFVVTYTNDSFDPREQIVGMVGNTCNASTYKRRLDVFRKVSEIQPSLEDRVDALESDVAALKGEAKTEYVRIDKSEAKAGDFVKFDESPNDYLTTGKYYEIYRVDGHGDPHIIDDEGDDFDTYEDVFEVYRKVSAAEPKPERLKVGDYAKVVGKESGHFAEIDEIVIVKRDDKDFAPYHCENLNGNDVGIFYEYELVRATDEEVAEAKDATARAKFKKGAKVRLKSGGGECPLNGFEDGKVYGVGDQQVTGGWDGRICITNGPLYGFATPAQLELLTEEEVAEVEEIEKWAAIGREVGEYKAGDIFRNPSGDLFEIKRIDASSSFPIVFIRPTGCEDGYKYDAAIELVTPVEARFDRKDAE
ncbi:hypothetical protein [Bacillus sp. NSP9.1]|uniref:hypothetical protein n=1 Tax=Bacillus sp. NSP9.1 TaxID=1071078 RepID=UPI0004799323|nr:hypothetical protein [Bacillus sp. NSP9.1]